MAVRMAGRRSDHSRAEQRRVMAKLVRLPAAATEAIAALTSSPSARQLWPVHSVDDWGRDDHLIRTIAPLVRLRWQVSASGHQHLPARAGALLVTNHRRFAWSPIYVALSLSEATGRPVRFAGRPDTAPFGPALRRLGGLLRDPSEVEGALRHGELVVVATSITSHPRHAGLVDHLLVGAASSAGVAVHPVASMSSPIGRAARVEVGTAIRPRRKRRGPLAEVELADLIRHRLQKMLDELGGLRTGMPPIDWLGEG